MEKIVNCWLSIQAACASRIYAVIEVMVKPMLIQVTYLSQSLVINLSPSGLKMPNIELGLGQIICRGWNKFSNVKQNI